MVVNNQDEIVSRILVIELYLTSKIFNKRSIGYKPKEGDEDQSLRNELLELRKSIGIIK